MTIGVYNVRPSRNVHTIATRIYLFILIISYMIDLSHIRGRAIHMHVYNKHTRYTRIVNLPQPLVYS